MGGIIINPADIERVVAANPPSASNALAYFPRRPLKNSAYAAVRDVVQEIGNVPVIQRGDSGIRPKGSSSVEVIEPMPIEIDDQFSAVELEQYERSSLGGKQQLIDEKLANHLSIIRATTKALAILAHRGKIDYMMKSGSALVRYTVTYGTIDALTNATPMNKLTPGIIVSALNDIVDDLAENNVGGPVEFIAERSLFSEIVTAISNQTAFPAQVGVGFVILAGFKILMDNDSYVDISTAGAKTTQRMLQTGELMGRATDAGQSMPYYKLDDVIMRQAVPFYSFTKDRSDQRGTDIFSKSKPLPLVNTKGIAILTFAAATVEKLTAPSADPSTSSFVTSVDVTLYHPDPDVTIFYTLDGSTPTIATGTAYDAPITVTATTTVKAIATKTGAISSVVKSWTYTKA